MEEVLDSELLKFLYESENGNLFVRHPVWWSQIVGNPFEKNNSNYIENQRFRDYFKNCNELLDTKQYSRFIYSVPKPTRIQWFYKLHKDIYEHLGNDEYYSLLGEVLIEVEFHHQFKEEERELIRIGNNPLKMMDSEDREVFDKLPNTLIVYRGISSDSPISLYDIKEFVGYSWTINKEKSLWFSRRFDRKFKYIFVTEVDKEHIFSYFNRREEEEIFLDYDLLDLSKIKVERIK